MAWKSIAIATGILLAFAFGGAWLLGADPRLARRVPHRRRLAALPDRRRHAVREAHRAARRARREGGGRAGAAIPSTQDDISVFPLAIPLISGPGAIASIMLFFAEHEDLAEPRHDPRWASAPTSRSASSRSCWPARSRASWARPWPRCSRASSASCSRRWRRSSWWTASGTRSASRLAGHGRSKSAPSRRGPDC